MKAARLKPFDADKHVGVITDKVGPVVDQSADRGKAETVKRKRSRITVSSGRPRRRVVIAKPFDPEKHLGAIKFKENIVTVIREMREGDGKGCG